MARDFGPPEMMAIALARLLYPFETVFHGVASPLPAVAVRLARELNPPGPVYLSLAGGVDARPSGRGGSTCSADYLDGSVSRFGLAEIFDLAARGGLDLAFLSGVQIDASGRLNSSVIGDFAAPKVRFPGGAGGAVLLPNAGRTLVWRAKHDTRVFVEACDFATSAGRLDRVVTPLAVFRFIGGRLVLESVHPYSSVEEVRRNTGFPVSDAPSTPAPSARELDALERVDAALQRRAEFE